MTNFQLVIKNADGSPYWTEYFQTKKDLNIWLDEEKTRKYWRKDFIVEIVDNSEAVAKAEKDALDALKVQQDKKELLISDLKKFKKTKKPSADEIQQAILNILALIGIQDD